MHQYDLFARLTYIPEIISPVVILAFAAIGLWALSARALSKLQTVAVLAAASLAVAAGVKDHLKLAFGRTWPETWVRDNPSLIRDGVYGFNPFHGGPGFAAFPSGHTAAICAVMSVLWLSEVLHATVNLIAAKETTARTEGDLAVVRARAEGEAAAVHAHVEHLETALATMRSRRRWWHRLTA